MKDNRSRVLWSEGFFPKVGTTMLRKIEEGDKERQFLNLVCMASKVNILLV